MRSPEVNLLGPQLHIPDFSDLRLNHMTTCSSPTAATVCLKSAMNKTYVHHTASRTRRPDMTAQLHKAGVDTEGFLSLRLHQSLIPEGAELTIQIRDKQTGELFTMNLNDDDNRIFGKNSRFYGQMILSIRLLSLCYLALLNQWDSFLSICYCVA